MVPTRLSVSGTRLDVKLLHKWIAYASFDILVNSSLCCCFWLPSLGAVKYLYNKEHPSFEQKKDLLHYPQIQLEYFKCTCMIILIKDQVINPYFEISLESSGKNETGPSMFSKSGNSLHDLPSSLRVELATRVKSSAPFPSVDESLYVVANSSMHFFKNKLPKKKTQKKHLHYQPTNSWNRWLRYL